MARLLLIFNDTVIFQEIPLPSAELARAVREGSWRPSAPYDALLDEAGALVHVVQVGGVVVVALSRPDSTPLPPPDPASGAAIHLPERQRQVLQALAEGLSDKEIALRVGLSLTTVRHYIHAVKGRLGARTRAQLVNEAYLLGLVKMKRRNGG